MNHRYHIELEYNTAETIISKHVELITVRRFGYYKRYMSFSFPKA